MKDSVQFTVHGVPAPQGSKSAFVRGGRAVIVDGSSASGRAKHHAWRQDVLQGARDALAEHGPFPGLVEVDISFRLPMPASDPHRRLHGTAPDVDKLIRSVLDSLTNSGLIVDDARVWKVSATKWYAREGHPVGAVIHVKDCQWLEDEYRQESKAAAKAARVRG